VLGAEPDWVYVACDISIGNACFSEEESEEVRKQLGFDPKAYIDIHFTSTAKAFELADRLTHEMQAAWGGVIDYTGTGGGLGHST
jgi:hypothetical protein